MWRAAWKGDTAALGAYLLAGRWGAGGRGGRARGAWRPRVGARTLMQGEACPWLGGGRCEVQAPKLPMGLVMALPRCPNHTCLPAPLPAWCYCLMLLPGGHPDCADRLGQTPLQFAAGYGHAACVQVRV